MQYTIETRELTNEHHRTAYDVASNHMTIEASDADEAITQYVRERDAELVSFTNPASGQESIATVKKEDAMFLVRVYSA